MLCTLDENYEVTEYGQVYSKPRAGTRGGILKQHQTKTGYLTVTLGSSKKPVKVHRLIALAFIENPDNKPYVNHKDGNKLNNSVANLEWVTTKENTEHAIKMKLRKPMYGEQHGQSKLTNALVTSIRESYIPYDREYGSRALAKKYKLGKSTIGRVVREEGWNS